MIGKKSTLGIFFTVLLAYYFSRYGRSKLEGKIVQTNSGSVKGIISLSRDGQEFYEWLGIPYAKPPVGQLRFASPQPIDRWDGIRDASAYGGKCAQLERMVLQAPIGVEDCLFLNIHAPKKINSSSELLPVLFFIHGGYFMCGSSDGYLPDYFMDEDVVLVTINYRLGALGFLSTADSVVRGNMGLKDQSLALKWTKENIANFGGNPEQITIFGESAGGTSVHFHMLADKSRGLMKKAISQSGTALSGWALYEDPRGQATNFAKKLKCPTESSAEMIKCLRDVDVIDILQNHRDVLAPTRTKDKFFVPVIETVVDEETFISDHPLNIINSGNFEKIPWFTGVNSHEGLIITHSVYKNATYREILENDWNMLADSLLYLAPKEKKYSDKIKEFYFGKGSQLDLVKQFSALTDIVTDRIIMGCHHAAVTQSKHAPVYTYYYSKDGPSVLFNLLVMLKGHYSPVVEVLYGMATNWVMSQFLGKDVQYHGACHADELTMLFDMPRISRIDKGERDYVFSKDLIKLWVAYASNKSEEVIFRNQRLPAFNTQESLQYLEIKEEPSISELPINERIQFWSSLHKEIKLNLV